jgi:hypothetical protein
LIKRLAHLISSQQAQESLKSVFVLISVFSPEYLSSCLVIKASHHSNKKKEVQMSRSVNITVKALNSPDSRVATIRQVVKSLEIFIILVSPGGKILPPGGRYLENIDPGYGYAIVDIASEIVWSLNNAKK